MTTKRQPKSRSNFGDDLVAALREVVAIERGELAPAKVTRRATARNTTAAPTPDYPPARVKKLRAGLGLSQPVFAKALNVSPATVRAWEIGQKHPNGASLRLLQWAEQHPALVRVTLRNI